ncbi:MAG: glycosyltransferase family 2 protein [Candidatus Aminicenantia bacterium]
MVESRNRTVELSIIIVNYNGKNYLSRCLKSIYQFPPSQKFEIIVVDNNSNDSSQKMVRKSFPEVKLICNKENLGFTRANNKGIQLSQGKFILFLNNDTRILAHSLDILLHEIKKRPEIGVIAPALLNEDYSYQLSYGLRPNLKNEFWQKYFANLFFKSIIKKKGDNWEKEVDWVSGACFLTTRDILDKVNLLDERFFLYFDDPDLCTQIKKLGKKIFYFPKAKIFHYLGKSRDVVPQKHALEYRKSQLYFYQKHCAKIEFNLLKFYLVIKFGLLFLLSKIFPFFGKAKIASEIYLKILQVVTEKK